MQQISSVFSFGINPQANITETRCPIRYRSRDKAFKIFLTRASGTCYFVFEAVNTAGLSLKMIRYCFGLKQNPGFWFNHTISRLLCSFITRILRVIFT